MSELPPFRPIPAWAYHSLTSPENGHYPNPRLEANTTSTVEHHGNRKKSPLRLSRKTRTLSNNVFEGLVVDPSPENTERISDHLNQMLEQLPASPSLFSMLKCSAIESPTKEASVFLHHNVANTTIIMRRRSLIEYDVSHNNASNDRDENPIAQETDEDQLPDNMYSFIVDDPEKSYAQFMQAHKCYDIIPTNTKLVILDKSLDVRKAFHALIYNGVRSALLWNSDKQRLCGMLTMTDFILILLQLYETQKETVGTDLEKHLISEWRSMLKKDAKLKPLCSVTAAHSLYHVIEIFNATNYHRIPVMDEISGNPLYFLTHKRILRFLYLYHDQLPRPSFMDKSVRDLCVGTCKDLVFVYPDTPLIECLAKLTSRQMSAVPVIERDTRKVLDIYARFDAIGVAVEQSYHRLDKTVAEALEHRKLSNWYEGVLTCLETDKFCDIVKKLVIHEVQGLIVVDSENVLRGMLTLSDVLRFMVFRPIMECENEDMSP